MRRANYPSWDPKVTLHQTQFVSFPLSLERVRFPLDSASPHTGPQGGEGVRAASRYFTPTPTPSMCLPYELGAEARAVSRTDTSSPHEPH